MMAIVFTVVMFLITALDRSELGLAKINQSPLYTLQDQLHGKHVHGQDEKISMLTGKGSAKRTDRAEWINN